MAITASVTSSQIEASVSESQIDVSVSGGIGPAGAAGVVAATAPITYSSQTVGISTGTGLSTAGGTLTVSYGSSAGTACEGNDARLSDSRTPTAHKTSHQSGGTDELALAASQITSGTIATARLASGTADATTYLRGDQTWAAVSGGAGESFHPFLLGGL